MVNVAVDKWRGAQSAARGSGVANLFPATSPRTIIPVASDGGWISNILLRDRKENVSPTGRRRRTRRWIKEAARGAAAKNRKQ